MLPSLCPENPLFAINQDNKIVLAETKTLSVRAAPCLQPKEGQQEVKWKTRESTALRRRGRQDPRSRQGQVISLAESPTSWPLLHHL